jgi:hypothetical protein
MSLESRVRDRCGTSVSLRDFEGISAVEGPRNEGSGPCSVFNYNPEFALQLRKLMENVSQHIPLVLDHLHSRTGSKIRQFLNGMLFCLKVM